MLRTRFTDLVGCSVPIQQAGMGAGSPPRLAAAVSEAGGLGMLGTGRGGINAETLGGLLDELRGLTTRPFGVNFILNPVFAANRAFWLPLVEQAAAAARVVEFFWDVPDRELVELTHRQGALVFYQCGSAEAAAAAAAVGCDLVVAQGVEAGGHVHGRVGMLALLADVLAAVRIPVLAAGGIGSGRAMAAALAAGADGVRIGTRLVAAAESGIHPRYAEALVAGRAEDTLYTTAFSVGWEDAPHRVLRSCVEAAEAVATDIVGERTWLDGTRVPVRRFSVGVPIGTDTGSVEAMALWAGESVSAVTAITPAADIIRELAAEAEDLLRRWCSG